MDSEIDPTQRHRHRHRVEEPGQSSIGQGPHQGQCEEIGGMQAGERPQVGSRGEPAKGTGGQRVTRADASHERSQQVVSDAVAQEQGHSQAG